MFLVTEDLKVAVSTHHIPISQVAENISKEKIKKQIRVLNQTLIEDFCIQKPKIAVLGLNPHAGDGGVIGTEEIEIIAPAIKELSDNGILAFGPFLQTVSSNPANTKALMQFWRCIMIRGLLLSRHWLMRKV